MVGDKPRNGEARRREAEMVRRALAGDLDAGNRLVNLCHPVIQARVRRKLARYRMAEYAEDVVQTVWRVLFKDDARQLLAFDPTRGMKLANYVGMIAAREAQNEANKLLTRGHGQRPPSSADMERLATELSSPYRRLEAKDLLQALGEHLEATLPDKGFRLYHLVFLDGLSTKEAAAALGVSEQVIHNWKHKIRTAARAFLVMLQREADEKDDDQS